jgi:hypothetical protein
LRLADGATCPPRNRAATAGTSACAGSGRAPTPTSLRSPGHGIAAADARASNTHQVRLPRHPVKDRPARDAAAYTRRPNQDSDSPVLVGKSAVARSLDCQNRKRLHQSRNDLHCLTPKTLASNRLHRIPGVAQIELTPFDV